jgi:hypothetical protein
MATKRRADGQPEMLSRNVAISSFRTSVRLSASHRRGEEPEIQSQPGRPDSPRTCVRPH